MTYAELVQKIRDYTETDSNVLTDTIVNGFIENASGFSITVTDTNNYTFSLGATPTRTEKGGGITVTAGPVTLTP